MDTVKNKPIIQDKINVSNAETETLHLVFFEEHPSANLHISNYVI